MTTARIGFSGTRQGMTDAQKVALQAFLKHAFLSRGSSEFHHGDAIGADAEAHEIASDCGLLPIIHPSTSTTQRAYCKSPEYLIRRPLPPLERNRKIVAEVTELVAAPFEAEEQKRGGTWYTIRLANNQGRQVTLLLPDGSTELYVRE